MSRKPPKYDPQREKVYSLEKTFMDSWMSIALPKRTLLAIAKQACKRWKVKVPKLVFASDPNWSGMYFHDTNTIELYARGRNPAVVLHEVAHHIDDLRGGGPEADSHGPTFCSIERDLLGHFRIMPKEAYNVLAKKFGVKVGKVKRPGKNRR